MLPILKKHFYLVNQKKLEFRGIEISSSGYVRILQVTKELIAERVDEVKKLLEKIEEADEVQNVFHSIQEYNPSELINIIADTRRSQYIY